MKPAAPLTEAQTNALLLIVQVINQARVEFPPGDPIYERLLEFSKEMREPFKAGGK